VIVIENIKLNLKRKLLPDFCDTLLCIEQWKYDEKDGFIGISNIFYNNKKQR